MNGAPVGPEMAKGDLRKLLILAVLAVATLICISRYQKSLHEKEVAVMSESHIQALDDLEQIDRDTYEAVHYRMLARGQWIVEEQQSYDMTNELFQQHYIVPEKYYFCPPRCPELEIIVGDVTTTPTQGGSEW